MASVAPASTQVLIAGGGPVGLATAIELGRRNVDELPTISLARGCRVLGLGQDEGEVRVAVASEGGEESMVSADFVVGCDGARSVVRAAIGSDYVGEHAVRPNLGMVFRAPALLDRVGHGPDVQYWIVNRSAPALMGPIDLKRPWWMIAFGVDRESGERDAPGVPGR